MALRLNQNTIDTFKNAMIPFLPEYIENNLSKAKSYDYTFRAFFGLINIPFHWRDIVFEYPEFDIKGVKLYFINNRSQ